MLFVPKGTEHMHKDLGVVWLYYSKDSVQLFFKVDHCSMCLEAQYEKLKVKFSWSFRSWLKVSRAMENNIILHDFVLLLGNKSKT